MIPGGLAGPVARLSGRHAGIVGWAIALAVVLAACTGTPDPTASTMATSPTGTVVAGPSTSTSTTSSTTSKDPPTSGSAATGTYPADVPDAARADTTEGAEAFASYYLGLVNEAYATPKIGLLPPLYSSTCKSCAKFESNAADYVSHRYRFDGPALKIGEASTNWQDNPKSTRRVIDVVVHQNAANVVDPGNRIQKVIPPDDLVLVLTLSRSTGGWMVELVQVMG